MAKIPYATFDTFAIKAANAPVWVSLWQDVKGPSEKLWGFINALCWAHTIAPGQALWAKRKHILYKFMKSFCSQLAVNIILDFAVYTMLSGKFCYEWKVDFSWRLGWLNSIYITQFHYLFGHKIILLFCWGKLKCGRVVHRKLKQFMKIKRESINHINHK